LIAAEVVRACAGMQLKMDSRQPESEFSDPLAKKIGKS